MNLSQNVCTVGERGRSLRKVLVASSFHCIFFAACIHKSEPSHFVVFLLLLFFLFWFFFRATPVAYGSSQARGGIGAAAAGLHHSHSNVGSEPHLQPMLQLVAMLDP